jgi:hypothetical protein
MMIMANEKKNGYDVARDLCVAPALVIWLDAATGAAVSGPGEGVEGFGIVARQMMQEDGKAGPIRVSIHGAFVAKAASGNRQRWQRWMVGPGGKCTLGDPTEGAVCLGSGTGRLDPHLAGPVYGKAAEYAAKLTAALARKAKAA